MPLSALDRLVDKAQQRDALVWYEGIMRRVVGNVSARSGSRRFSFRR